MCTFPAINYENSFASLDDGYAEQLPPSPKGMFSILLNKGIVEEHFLDGIHNINELESEIFNLIDHDPENGASRERIFHLIEIWGGRTGRGLYCNQVFQWRVFGPLYNELITDFSAIQYLDDSTLVQAANSVRAFYDAIHEKGYSGMSIAFITKHSRFWMHRNLANSMLPVYDSTFALNVMQKRTVNFRDLLPYWRGMKAKSEQEHVSLTSLERQLFNYFRAN